MFIGAVFENLKTAFLMIDPKTPHQITHQDFEILMADYIIKKYKGNIDSFMSSLKIYPKFFKEKKSMEVKNWCVYFYYYQNGIRKKYTISSYIENKQKIAVNRIKNHKLKKNKIKFLKDFIAYKLKNDPQFIVLLIYGEKEGVIRYPSVFGYDEDKNGDVSISEAFEIALKIKRKSAKEAYYSDLKSVSNRFLKFIHKNKNDSVELLSKKMFVDFLHNILDSADNRTYNNARSNLSPLLSVMVDKELIKENFVLKIKKLETKAKLNKAFSKEQRIAISVYLKKYDIKLYYYYLHIYYGLMRPSTIIRLQVRDVDLENRVFLTYTKTGDFIKKIPNTLYNEFYKNIDIKNANAEDYIFSREGVLEQWGSSDLSKRQYYGKLFLPVKKHFKLDKNYTWYSFRHSAIGDIFENKVKELQKNNEPNYIEKAIDFIRQFTNHTTNAQTKQYLRGITSSIHVDWSDYLE